MTGTSQRRGRGDEKKDPPKQSSSYSLLLLRNGSFRFQTSLPFLFCFFLLLSCSCVSSSNSREVGSRKKMATATNLGDLEPIHELTKRSYDFTGFDFFKILNNVIGPQGIPINFAIAGAILTSQLVAYVGLAFIYNFLLATTTGETRRSVEGMEFLLGRDVMTANILRVVRNVSFGLFGRLAIDAIIYGPQLTYEGATSKTFAEIFAMPFDPMITPTFIGRTMIDGFAMFGGFLVIGLIGGMASPPTPKRKKRFSDSAAEEIAPLPFSGIPSVQEALEGGVERIIQAIESS